jgi:hypothetical protein
LANQETGRADLEQRLVWRATADPAFRERLLADPRAAIEEELGIDLPASMQIDVIEEGPHRLCLTLPMDLSGIGRNAVWAMTGRRPERRTPTGARLAKREPEAP